jgi:serine/threonine-protein phosphatase 2A regulatory subunit A
MQGSQRHAGPPALCQIRMCPDHAAISHIIPPTFGWIRERIIYLRRANRSLLLTSFCYALSCMPAMTRIRQAQCCRDSLRTNKDALRRISRAAAALGPQRTRDELVPYISEPQEDDDEYLLVLAEELGGLLDAVGGSQHAAALFAPLETLAASDENTVRAAAVVSYQAVIKGMTPGDVEAQLLPVLTRLATGCFPTRVSACALYANVHPLVSRNEQVRLRGEFEVLTSDSHPVVRRAAAANLARLASASGPEHIDFYLGLFRKFVEDRAALLRCHVTHEANA